MKKSKYKITFNSFWDLSQIIFLIFDIKKTNFQSLLRFIKVMGDDRVEWQGRLLSIPFGIYHIDKSNNNAESKVFFQSLLGFIIPYTIKKSRNGKTNIFQSLLGFINNLKGNALQFSRKLSIPFGIYRDLCHSNYKIRKVFSFNPFWDLS